MKVFQELGALIEERWKDKNYDDEIFPAIAEQALMEADLLNRVDPWEIVRWTQTTTQLPLQQDIDAKFGNPPITLYNGSRFYVDIYFWLDGTTEIHQHSFCGAFQVLAGSSIHSHHQFELVREINSRFLVGHTELKSVKLLREGDVQKILPGNQYIHALFHLERPSATITVRTQGLPKELPQYSYLKPHIAHDPFYKETQIIRRLQTTSLLLHMKHPEADSFIADLISNADFQTTFYLLNTTFTYLSDTDLSSLFNSSAGTKRFDSLLEKARSRHGALVEFLPPVFDEMRRQGNIIKRRATITDSDHRFFLALLLNVPDRIRLLELVKSRHPERDPVEIVTDWVDELTTTKVYGSTEQNVLGLSDFDDLHLFVFQCMLAGMNEDESKLALHSEYPTEQAKELEERLEGVCSSLQSSLLFRDLFGAAKQSADTAKAVV
ncbi:MAG TPA: hypothetical protein VK619_14790 [Pyrinomonadaceae bacterium]|nr:hypothetical protein [Pyrinomonadaceae bacterium]